MARAVDTLPCLPESERHDFATSGLGSREAARARSARAASRTRLPPARLHEPRRARQGEGSGTGEQSGLSHEAFVVCEVALSELREKLKKSQAARLAFGCMSQHAPKQEA